MTRRPALHRRPAVRTRAADGVLYASKTEAARADYNRLRVLGGLIRAYEPHPAWDLDVPPALPTLVAWLREHAGEAVADAFRVEFTPRVRRIARNGHRADFRVLELDGSVTYEETKGGPPSRDFWLRKWTAEALHGVRIHVIRAAGRGAWEPYPEDAPLTPMQRKLRGRPARRPGPRGL